MVRSPTLIVPHVRGHLHHINIPVVLHPQNDLLRALGSEGNVFRTHSTLKRTVTLLQGLGESAPVHRSLWEGWWADNVSESIPSYQVEREHVKYKEFKVLKNFHGITVFVVQKTLCESLPLTWCKVHFSVKQISDLTNVFYGPEHKSTEKAILLLPTG